MWHFSMQGLPANDVTIKSRGLLPHIFSLTPTLSQRRVRRQLFSVALSVTPTYFSALVEIPGYSPVHCSVLSRLSFPLLAGRYPGLQRMANLILKCGSVFKKYFGSPITKTGVILVDKSLYLSPKF